MTTEPNEISTEEVEDQLKRLRSSTLFSHSRRYPLFLDYVVRKTLEGHSDELKERTVGVEAFGRPPGYDLNADPIVRVIAGEVRKRLAQYYYQVDHQKELRIELNPGSYVPEFRLSSEAPILTIEKPFDSFSRSSSLGAHQLPPNVLSSIDSVSLANDRLLVAAHDQVRKWKYLALFCLVAFLTAIIGAALPLFHRALAVDEFWQPIIDANSPVVISVASVVAMVNSNAQAPAPTTVSGHPLASDPIAVSDATALSSIQQVLSLRSKTSTLESSTSTSFSDLQKGPIVLISGFNNLWTMRITDPLRFHFVRTSTDDYTIQDRTDPGNRRWSINGAKSFAAMDQDYGIIARFQDQTTGQLVVVAAGIGENGTIAASRFLTDERSLAEMKRSGIWPHAKQNFEAIVETQIIDGKPGPPRVVASNIW